MSFICCIFPSNWDQIFMQTRYIDTSLKGRLATQIFWKCLVCYKPTTFRKLYVHYVLLTMHTTIVITGFVLLIFSIRTFLLPRGSCCYSKLHTNVIEKNSWTQDVNWTSITSERLIYLQFTSCVQGKWGGTFEYKIMPFKGNLIKVETSMFFFNEISMISLFPCLIFLLNFMSQITFS